MSLGHPPAEVEIDELLVRALVEHQAPELAALPIEFAGNGWDNAMYRLGPHHVVRLPRRAVAATLIANEQRCLPELAPRLPLEVPVPTHLGTPGHGFPWPWTICRWITGERSSVAPPSDLLLAADQLASFVNALHQPAPADAPENPVRGGPHADRIERITARIESVGAAGKLPPGTSTLDVVTAWIDLASAPAWTRPPVWLHGDLHGSNILTRDGTIRAVIDFGDVTSGDPATDLAVGWVMLDAPARARFQGLVDRDDATWRRAAAWALSFGVMYLDAGDTDAALGAMGRHTIAQVLGTPTP